MSNVVEIDPSAWVARNAHWQSKCAGSRSWRPVRQRENAPLILCGHGVSLRIERDTLAIKNGFTHYPQERETFRFFKGDLSLPQRIVMLDGSGSLSFDVISWLASQNVALVKIDWRGEVVSVIGGSGFSARPDRLHWQIETRNDPALRLEFCCDLIAAKLRNTLPTLHMLPESNARQIAFARAEVAIARLERRDVKSVDQVRVIEMGAAAAYFVSWRGVHMRFKSQSWHPIPNDWQKVSSRRSMRRPWASNRHATHPMNAMLNYAYAALQSQVQVEAAAEGYDPRRGIMHHDRDDSQALVYDLMEPRRGIVDARLLSFVDKSKLTGADFVIRTDGVCRLAPQLARRVCALVSEKGPHWRFEPASNSCGDRTVAVHHARQPLAFSHSLT